MDVYVAWHYSDIVHYKDGLNAYLLLRQSHADRRTESTTFWMVKITIVSPLKKKKSICENCWNIFIFLLKSHGVYMLRCESDFCGGLREITLFSYSSHDVTVRCSAKLRCMLVSINAIRYILFIHLVIWHVAYIIHHPLVLVLLPFPCNITESKSQVWKPLSDILDRTVGDSIKRNVWHFLPK